MYGTYHGEDRGEVEREFAREQVETRQRWIPLPFWNDYEALRQMSQFCMSAVQGSTTFSSGYWSSSSLRNGRLPAPDLQAQLIKTALAEGWKLGYTSVYDVPEPNAQYRV